MELNINMEEMRKHSILVCTPMYGGACHGLFAKACNDLAMLATKYQIKLAFYYIFNESLIPRARNYCVDEFLRSDFTHLMFIDSDIGFNANDVMVSLAVQISDPEEFNIVCGPYPKKCIAWEKIKLAVEKGFAENPNELQNFVGDYVFNPVGNTQSFRIDEPVEVMEAGTGFMMVDRNTFKKWAEAFPEKSYKPDHARTEHFNGTREIHAYFDCIIDPKSKRYLSEDYYFCQKAREVGLKVWLCPWMELQHVGSYVFGGSLAAIAAVGAAPTVAVDYNEKKVDKKELPDNLSGLNDPSKVLKYSGKKKKGK